MLGNVFFIWCSYYSEHLKYNYVYRSNEKKIIASLSESTAYDIESTMKTTEVSKRTGFRIRKEQRETGVLTSPKRWIRGAYKNIDTLLETGFASSTQSGSIS